MKGNGHCLIWNTEAEQLPARAPFGTWWDSPRAGGRYFIDQTTYYGWKYDSNDEKARLTSCLIDRRRVGEDFPEITRKALEDARHRRPLTVHERADRLLREFSSELSDIADGFGNQQDESRVEVQRRLAHSESLRVQEINYLVSYLEHRHWIERDGSTQHPIARYRISVEGYARLAELDRTATDSSKAFVAMWFDDSMNEVWENAIEPGIEDAGYEAIRIDRKGHLNKIDDEIIAELRRARFVVADFTHGDDGARGGVYYEAGFAYGLKLPFILSCRRDSIEKVHFRHASISPYLVGGREAGRVPPRFGETHQCNNRRRTACRMSERFSAWLAR